MYEVNGKVYSFDSVVNQRIKREFVEREIVTCQTSLIALMDNNIEGFSYEEVENYFKDNNEEIKKAKEYLFILEHVEIELTDTDNITFDYIDELQTSLEDIDIKEFVKIFKQLLKKVDVNIDNLTAQDNNFEIYELTNKCIQMIRDKIEEYQTNIKDLEKPTEILEWYGITKWFANKLREYKECILETDYGIYWGRTSKQDISLDSVISEIVYKIEILEGQPNYRTYKNIKE